MITVKHSNGSNLQQIQKKPFPFWIKQLRNFVPAMILASLLGTYLDLYFVGKGLYSFPMRPFPAIFSINIVFTLLVLPVFTAVFLLVCEDLKLHQKIMLILLLSIIMSISETFGERIGFFVHHDSWKHNFTFIGYIIFLTFIYLFNRWQQFR